jgi:hypothetical protein
MYHPSVQARAIAYITDPLRSDSLSIIPILVRPETRPLVFWKRRSLDNV